MEDLKLLIANRHNPVPLVLPPKLLRRLRLQACCWRPCKDPMGVHAAHAKRADPRQHALLKYRCDFLLSKDTRQWSARSNPIMPVLSSTKTLEPLSLLHHCKVGEHCLKFSSRFSTSRDSELIPQIPETGLGIMHKSNSHFTDPADDCHQRTAGA